VLSELSSLDQSQLTTESEVDPDQLGPDTLARYLYARLCFYLQAFASGTACNCADTDEYT
jgi:hypothetical protein